MAFDFPASPAVGDVSNGYVFNGVGWSGGPIIPTPTEQFFICDGMATLDVQVPSWAKGCEINGAIYIVNTAYLMARVSMDGTTFLAGASDYIYSGPYHNSQGAASAFGTYVGAGTTGFTLSATGNNGNYPINVNAEMILARATTAQYITSKSYAKNYNSTASAGYQTYWSQDLLGGAPMGSGLQVKALRFFLTSGNFGAGSWLRIKWLGGEVPQTNGTIPEAPADGGQYVRINGLWRLKEQCVNLAGLTQADITVPTWAKGAVLDGSVFPSVAATYAALQVSIDGTTFYAGTSYQLMGGIVHNVSGGYSTQAAGTAPAFYIDYPRSNLLVAHIFQCQLSLESNTTTQLITARSEMQAYDGTSLQSNMIWGGYLNINLTPPARVQKLRILTQGGGTFTNGYVNVRWLG